MTRPTIVLVIADDPRVSESFRSVVAERDAVLVETRDAANGLASARSERPDVIVVGLSGDASATPALCRALRGAEETSLASVIMVASDARPATPTDGADDRLSPPIDTAEARATLRWALRLRAVREAGRAGAEALSRMETERERVLEQTITALELIIELGIPGARLRGERCAARAIRLVERFEIPEPFRKDLEYAARLCELGRVATANPSALFSPPAEEQWQYTQATCAILRRVDGLAAAGELVASLYENWDGTGHPNHQLQGQNPLRSRILRALVDFESMSEKGTEAALERLMELAGTRYDPMVVTQLSELISNESGGGGVASIRTMLPVDALEVGMTLAEDLYSSSGLKLLSRDTVLTPAAIEAILRRHRAEPILHAAAIHRAA